MATVTDKNPEILGIRKLAYDLREGARIGDFIRLPYGLWTQITHIYPDGHVQTGFGRGSYYLSVGSISYSGGLDSGVKLTDLIETDETKESSDIWFFDQGEVGGGRGRYFKMDFRVFDLKEGADTSGIPDIRKYELKNSLTPSI